MSGVEAPPPNGKAEATVASNEAQASNSITTVTDESLGNNDAGHEDLLNMASWFCPPDFLAMSPPTNFQYQPTTQQPTTHQPSPAMSNLKRKDLSQESESQETSAANKKMKTSHTLGPDKLFQKTKYHYRKRKLARERAQRRENTSTQAPPIPLDTVEVTILPSGKTFHLNTKLLVEKSTYFCLAMTDGIRQSMVSRLTLQGVQVSDHTFAVFSKWLHGGTILPVLPVHNLPHSKPGGLPADWETALTWRDLVDLWFFAGSIGTPALQNHVVDNLGLRMHLFACEATHDRAQQIIDASKLLWQTLWVCGRSPNARTELGALPLAKPLCDMMLNFIANPKLVLPSLMTENLFSGLPSAFQYESHVRNAERLYMRFNVPMDSLYPLAWAHPAACSCGLQECHPDNDAVEHLDKILAMLSALNATVNKTNDFWRITARHYYVQEFQLPNMYVEPPPLLPETQVNSGFGEGCIGGSTATKPLGLPLLMPSHLTGSKELAPAGVDPLSTISS